jgi:anti-anti-sigma factor
MQPLPSIAGCGPADTQMNQAGPRGAAGGTRSTPVARIAVELRTRAHPGSHVVTVEVGGEIDIESGRCLRNRLCFMIWAHGPRLALDLAGVTFIDCAGLGALLATRRLARVQGGWLRLIAVSGCARRLIEITGLQDALAMPPAVPVPGLPGR